MKKTYTFSDSPSLPKPDVNGTPAAEPLRVLVVDDNDASAKTMGWTIELLGHEVRVAHYGAQAIELAKAFKPHIILLDIGLPDINGYEVCQQLRQVPGLENTIIVAQTGWGQQEHRQRSEEAGFDMHLVKPVSIATLQDLLASHSRRSAA